MKTIMRGSVVDNLGRKLEVQIIETILAHKKVEKIVIFGSRANGKHTKTSDIDIAIFGKEWSDRDVNLIRNELEERVKTPLKFDVLNFYAISKEKLRGKILKEGRIIYES